MVDLSELEKGDILYWTRILPKNKIKEVLEVTIVSAKDTYCVGCDLKTKQSYLITTNLFNTKTEAENFIKQK